LAQTAVGIVARSDEDAVSTVLFVLVLMVVIALAICEFVFAFITLARDVLAVRRAEFVFKLTAVVPALIALAIEVEAVPIVFAVLAVPAAIAAASDVLAEFVFSLTADVILEVCAFVFEFITEARDVDAVSTVAFVLALTADVPAVIAEAIELEAVFVLLFMLDIAPVTSEATARAPVSSVESDNLLVAYDQILAAVRDPPALTRASKLSTICLPTVPAPFNVDVATVHTSAARVPNDVSVLVELAQTAVGIVARSDEDAVSTVLFVLVLMVETAEVI
jgi:hypothetical protein